MSRTLEFKTDICVNLQFKKSTRNAYSRMKDTCLSSHNALTREMSVCMHSFPLLMIAYEINCLSTQISQHYHDTYTSF